MSKRRGLRVVPPPGSPPGCVAWLHRRADGGFHLTLRGPAGRLLQGSHPPGPGRPVTLWAERRSRPKGDPVAAVAKAKAIAARRAQVEAEAQVWTPPARMPEPLLPRTPARTAQLLRRLARRKKQVERIMLTDPAVEMPALPPNETPMSIEEGIRILEERYRLAVLRHQFPDASEEALGLM